MGTKNSEQLKVFMLPWLAHSHISSFIELAKKLTKRNIFIYLCSTPINLSSIKDKLISEDYSHSIQLVELHLPILPDLPPHYLTTNGLPPHLWNTLSEAFTMSKPTLSDMLTQLKPDIFIHDVLHDWVGKLASFHNIPSIEFLTGGAAAVSFFIHMFRNPGVKYTFPEIYLHEFEIEKLVRQFGSGKKENDQASVDVQSVDVQWPGTSCRLWLIRSFEELEAKYIENIQASTGKKVIPVGPLVGDPVDALDEKSEIVEWLDKKEKFSTIFVSFGSECYLSKEEIEEIAHGLELVSDVNFIWVIRFPGGTDQLRVEEVLPLGFLERVGERGRIVEGWAPQSRILRHGSIGGFVSHCGWGSIMEGVKCGVPIIALPMLIDQPINARLLVKAGLGLEVVKEERSGKIKGEEVAKVIREMMFEKCGEDVRKKAKEFSEKLKYNKGEEEIDGFVEDLVQICEERKG